MYKMFSSCISVKGVIRSIIYDLNRKKYEFIPNDLALKLTAEDLLSLDPDYIKYLEEKEFLFKLPDNITQLAFPKLSMKWYSPFLINNTIINIDNIDVSKFKDYYDLIDSTACKHYLLVGFEENSIKKIQLLLDVFLESKTKSITLFVKHSNEYSVNNVKYITKKYLRLKSLIIHSAKFRNTIHNSNDIYGVITYTDKEYRYKNNCFKLKKEHLTVDLRLFTECQKHNPYFNRKLYIGNKGEIKNAPECEEQFGYIQDIKDAEELKQIIAQPSFQKYWYVSPDMIDVTKDSELRYMCVDNRLPYQRKDGSWYYKEEPSYNPYICKWQGEEGYLTLKECGVIVNEEGYSRDDKKIAAINEKLWAE